MKDTAIAAGDERRHVGGEEQSQHGAATAPYFVVFFDVAGFAEATCFAGCAVMAVAIIDGMARRRRGLPRRAR